MKKNHSPDGSFHIRTATKSQKHNDLKVSPFKVALFVVYLLSMTYNAIGIMRKVFS